MRLRSLSRTNSSGVPRVRAVVGLRPPLLVGYTRKGLVRVPHQVRGESGKALKNGRDTQPRFFCQSTVCGGAKHQNTKFTGWPGSSCASRHRRSGSPRPLRARTRPSYAAPSRGRCARATQEPCWCLCFDVEKKMAFPKLAISCQFRPTRPGQSHRPCIKLLYALSTIHCERF